MWKRAFAVFFIAMLALVPAHNSWGGAVAIRDRAIGGVSIDPSGALRAPDVVSVRQVAQHMKQSVDNASAELTAPVEMRMVSLRGLEEALAAAAEEGVSDLPEEVQFLAGIQRIQFVFVYPETNDIVLAGPGEGWRVDEKGAVVGVTTGRPVIHLDDLLVAFRTVRNAREGQGISCSIDPTAEGRQNFAAYMSSLRTFRDFNQAQAEAAMGPQTITITGVPLDTHFARVMAAADFRMKRYAMKLEPAPVAGLPSFLDMLKAKRAALDNAMPRWWLACNYDGVARSEDGLAWQLKGPGVKVMTEDDFIAEDGQVRGAGKANPLAQQWADLFTEKYDELTRKDTVFGDLRNIMDLSVVAALIEKHGLLEKAGLQIPTITSSENGWSTEEWNAPKTVSTFCSFLSAGSQVIITASGGVQIESWQVANNTKQSDEMPQLHSKAASTSDVSGDAFWWN